MKKPKLPDDRQELIEMLFALCLAVGGADVAMKELKAIYHQETDQYLDELYASSTPPR